MADNVEEEIAVAASMDKLIFGQGTERKAAQHKRPGVERDFLFALLTLLSNHQNGIDLLCASGCDPDLGQDGSNWGQGGRAKSRTFLFRFERCRHGIGCWCEALQGFEDDRVCRHADEGWGVRRCNGTVPKPYLIGWQGDQLRAKAESPKGWNPMGGKGIVN
jgi:hypothetical protein